MTVAADLEPAPATGPVVGPDAIRFTFPDADRALSAVRLVQDVRIPGDQLDFAWSAGAWTLAIDRPPVDRMEYKFELAHSDGGHRVDHRPRQPGHGAGRLRRQVGARAARLPSAPLAGLRRAARPEPRPRHPHPQRQGRACTGALWSPPGVETDQPLPLLVVHDGPEYDELAQLTTYLSALIVAARIPPVRAALLAPGPRDDWYSGRRRLHPRPVPGRAPLPEEDGGHDPHDRHGRQPRRAGDAARPPRARRRRSTRCSCSRAASSTRATTPTSAGSATTTGSCAPSTRCCAATGHRDPVPDGAHLRVDRGEPGEQPHHGAGAARLRGTTSRCTRCATCTTTRPGAMRFDPHLTGLSAR